MAPYHAMMAHFPVAIYLTASIILAFRAISDGQLARYFDRVLVPLLTLGLVTGVITYVFGLMVWPADTLQTTPLGRNHMMAATWSMAYWTAVLALRWWVGERAWEGLTNRLIMRGREGRVIFQGDVHSGTGMYCADCHMAVFDVSRSAEITQRMHNRNVYCFTCHNGEMAFAPRRNCHLDEDTAD